MGIEYVYWPLLSIRKQRTSGLGGTDLRSVWSRATGGLVRFVRRGRRFQPGLVTLSQCHARSVARRSSAFFPVACAIAFTSTKFISGLIAITHEALSRLANAIDRWIIAGFWFAVLHGTTELFGAALRLVQTGNLQTYAFLFVAGVAVVLFFVLFRS